MIKWIEGQPVNRTIEAVYENGVFRPLEPVSLPEGEHVQVAVPELSEELFMSQMRRPETMKMEFANG
jgi:predicted DNA-binding antitoxin AbrB/MazE fold protein